MVWDEATQRWKSNINESKDNIFVRGVESLGLSQEEVDTLFINTYYVMLSRARNKMGIWFKDEVTKRHVMDFLGLDLYSETDAQFVSADEVNTLHEELKQTHSTERVVGNSFNRSYHRPECQYAPRNPEKRVEFASVEVARNEGYTPCRTCNP